MDQIDSGTPHRRSIRLKGYDYSRAGAYFVTICTQDRRCLFGEITAKIMRLNDPGRMIQTVWYELPQHYPGVDIDAFVIMPNHIHGIIDLNIGDVGQPQGVAPTTMSLPDVVHRLKSLTTTRYRKGVERQDWLPFPRRLWQRNYYEHVIRDEGDLNQLRQYITSNPLCWPEDADNPVNWIKDD